MDLRGDQWTPEQIREIQDAHRTELARKVATSGEPEFYGVYMTPEGPVTLFLTQEKPMTDTPFVRAGVNENPPIRGAIAADRAPRRLENITATAKELHAHTDNLRHRLEEIMHRLRGAQPVNPESVTQPEQDPDQLPELDRLHWWLNQVGSNLNRITDHVTELEGT